MKMAVSDMLILCNSLIQSKLDWCEYKVCSIISKSFVYYGFANQINVSIVG